MESKPGNKTNIQSDFYLPVNNNVTVSETELLRTNSKIVFYKRGETIFRQNTLTSSIMFIKSGMVKVYKEVRNNKTFILKLLLSDNYLALISVFSNNIHHYSASAVEPTEIVHIEKSVFSQFMKQNGAYAFELLQGVSNDGLWIFDRLISQYQKQLPGRIADVILYFSNSIYNNTVFDFPLSRRELAELAGTTKESFIRTLTEFKNDRIINLEGKRVEIISIELLKKLSEIG